MCILNWALFLLYTTPIGNHTHLKIAVLFSWHHTTSAERIFSCSYARAWQAPPFPLRLGWCHMDIPHSFMFHQLWPNWIYNIFFFLKDWSTASMPLFGWVRAAGLELGWSCWAHRRLNISSESSASPSRVNRTGCMMGYLFGTIFADDSWGEHVRGIRGFQAAGCCENQTRK